ncbi:MAG: site-specific DNA-methyltransferase [Clostridia bacterium]|nr:site-specific DNA-methyltransferase [Clostridia bacterium]
MDKLKMHSVNMVDENIKKIGELFPNCVTERVGADGKIEHAIDFDVLKQELSSVVVEGNDERYQFTWPDKKKSVLLANAPIAKTLRPCKEESVDFDKTENLYIEGDNLDVLKLLQETYLGKIKMIYIDPPYNTGNDFVYEDDFSESAEEYLANSGQFDEQGNRLVANTESNGRFHTDWLNMIYPRLKLAKNLLSEDGVVFISIDDNETENLRKVGDEVFGEDNFIGKIVWQSTQKNDPRFIAINHEYVLCYTKNKEIQNLAGKWRTRHPLVEEMMSEYEKIRGKYSLIEDIQSEWNKVINKDKFFQLKHYKYVDYRGPYFAADISDPQRKGPKHDFVIHPITKQLCKAPAGGYSPREAEMRRRLENDEIHFGATHEQVVCAKKYLITAEDRLNSVYYEDGRRATKQLEALIGKGIFDHPKSEIMIKRLLSFVTNKDSVVLDFFSGSATTAHAVMQLNAEDGGNRKFIMVQLPEETEEKSEAYKAGYKNICEIGKERIRRAGNKIKEDICIFKNDYERLNKPESENSQFVLKGFGSLRSNGVLESKDYTYENEQTGERKHEKFETSDPKNKYRYHPELLDTGFRVLKLDSSNMKDVYYTPDDYVPSLFDDLTDNIKKDRTPEDLLFQVMLDLGILLSSKIEETTVAGKKVFSVEDGFLMACFDKDVTDETITAIAKQKPYYFVMRDSSMASDSVAANFEQIFATYSPDTVRKVL